MATQQGFPSFSGALEEPEPSSKRAVTLFELLIVVLVTAILAIIFVVSSQVLIVRTKISRVKEEQRVLARALDNYQMDYDFLPSEETGLRALVAPTAYLATVPRDPFGQGGQYYQYVKLDQRGRLFAVVSAGPDGHFNLITPSTAARAGDSSREAAATASAFHIVESPDGLNEFLATYSYDPTNGMVSDGDLITLVITN